ncbi:MAG TPA: ferritin-like domain-containing protein, partial [Gaiellaceae bacterium]|nr:ferritin-like domain-containing protein [Gaiellaceae bacterium]
MEVEEAIETLNRALSLQARSALAFTLAAGTARGIPAQAVAVTLWEFAQAELDDTRRLVEKIVALGGQPTTDVAPLEAHDELADAVRWLAEVESDAVEALAEVIPHTGNEGPGEALEHLLEHVIM